MRFCLIVLLAFSAALGAAATTAPTTQKSTPSSTRPASPPSTQPINVPYTLTDTNHLLVRLKINGKGPFNFIVDTGSPAMIVRVPVADALGLKPSSRGIAVLDKVEVEGGIELRNVSCYVETPYQIEGMNAIGASGVELDGLLGYSILAKFRIQIDLAIDRMVWTPNNFAPPPLVRTRDRRRPGRSTARPTTRPTTRPASFPTTRPSPTDNRDRDEARLESTGGFLKLLGPLIKTTPTVPKVRGFVGVELNADAGSVTISNVLGDSPAAGAGLRKGDRIVAVNDHPVHTIADVQQLTARTLAGQMVRLCLKRADDPLNLNLAIIAGEGF